MFPSFPSDRFGDRVCGSSLGLQRSVATYGELAVGIAGERSVIIRRCGTKDLKNLPVWEIAEEDCLLFMWATSPHLDQAMDLGKAWGFLWGTIGFVWQKGKANPGFYTMSENEVCLVFKRGRIPQPRGARNVRQTITSMRGCHSRKPDEARRRIGLMFPEQRKIELFARAEVAGWTAWGLGVNKTGLC